MGKLSGHLPVLQQVWQAPQRHQARPPPQTPRGLGCSPLSCHGGRPVPVPQALPHHTSLHLCPWKAPQQGLAPWGMVYPKRRKENTWRKMATSPLASTTQVGMPGPRNRRAASTGSPPAVEPELFPLSLSFLNYKKTSTSYLFPFFVYPRPVQDSHLEQVHSSADPAHSQRGCAKA